VTGRDAEHSLERAHMTCNKNGVPFDTAPFTVTSGIRLAPGRPTRGFGTAEFTRVGQLIGESSTAWRPTAPRATARSRPKGARKSWP